MLSRTAPIVFDTATLSLFSKRLLNCPKFKINFTPDFKEAAVLVPLCVVDGKPSVLFTVRNMTMRTHRGEIRYTLFFFRKKIVYDNVRDVDFSLLIVFLEVKKVKRI